MLVLVRKILLKKVLMKNIHQIIIEILMELIVNIVTLVLVVFVHIQNQPMRNIVQPLNMENIQ